MFKSLLVLAAAIFCLDSSLAGPANHSDTRANTPSHHARIDGLTLSKINPGSIYDKLGLKIGDIILEANGKKLDSPESALEFADSLKTADRVELKIKRAGQIKVIEYQLNTGVPKARD